MAAPLVPSPLDYVGRRRFSFYPPIAQVGPNSWVLGSGSQHEVQVVNAETGCELWIARQYIGGVSEAPEAPLVVDLTKALEHHKGVVTPQVRRVIEMPAEREGLPKVGTSAIRFGPAAVVEIRLESKTESIRNKAFATACIAALVLALLAALVAGTFRL